MKKYLNRALRCAFVACVLGLIACDYDVPITTTPTGPVDERLLAEWTLVSPGKSEHMKIRKFDDSNYVVSYDGDLYRAHHSNLAGLPLVSVQWIDGDERKYAYFSWRLSDDTNRLTIRTIRASVVPKETKDTATIAKLIERHRDNPELFEETHQYTRDRRPEGK